MSADETGMASTSNITVVSPTRVRHAVRPGADATACGLNYRRKRRRAQNGRVGWVRIAYGFEDVISLGREVCKRCVECLRDGMGPGASGR